jgi:hypothetical protein
MIVCARKEGTETLSRPAITLIPFKYDVAQLCRRPRDLEFGVILFCVILERVYSVPYAMTYVVLEGVLDKELFQISKLTSQ